VEIDPVDRGNEWDMWVYPDEAPTQPSAGVVIVNRLDAQAEQVLRQGGRVLLLMDPADVKTNVALGFTPIFWNTAWTVHQPPHTLGVLVDPAHPALADFPTEFHSNWQWWDVISRAATMELDAFPPTYRPIIQIVPDWFYPRRLGLLMEAQVAGGRLIVCSIDLENDLNDRPAARQLRASLLRYMAGPHFQPQHELTLDQIHALMRTSASSRTVP